MEQKLGITIIIILIILLIFSIISKNREATTNSNVADNLNNIIEVSQPNYSKFDSNEII